MTETNRTPDESDGDHLATLRERLLDAALPHVAFDGWSRTTLRQAAGETGNDMAMASLAFPRGGLDMVLAFHRRADHELGQALARADSGSMRIRDRITFAVRKRIEIIAPEREAARRGASLLALPLNAPEGARAVWETSDLIWTWCGDSSTDYNWYTKRAILASVLSSTMLYWLSDHSLDLGPTRAFLDRRIENVMQFEKKKAAVLSNPIIRAFGEGPGRLLRRPGAPSKRHGESGQRPH